MRKSLSWLVVESGDAAAITKALAVQRTGSQAQRHRMPLAGRVLDDGRYLIVAGSVDHPAFARRKLAALAHLAPFTFCELEEHVMWSSVERWERGRKTWSVAHRGEDSALDLRTNGNLPAEFAALETAALAQQHAEGGVAAGVDLLFDLPIDFARHQTGVHPDDPAFDAPHFEQLRGGWRERWHTLPLLAQLAVGILVLYAFLYLAGALYRAL
jgi:hypothetical protein